MSPKRFPYSGVVLNPIAHITVLLFVVLISLMIGTGISFLLATGLGIDIQDYMKDFLVNDKFTANPARTLILINHLFSFILPGILVAFFVGKNGLGHYLTLDKLPKLGSSIAAMAILVCTMPIIAILYYLNQQIPLPEVLQTMESNTNDLIANMLDTQSIIEIIFNILVIAIVPAIGEELIFRGHLQRQFSKIFQNPHVGNVLAALLFSSIHLQFEGFIPRFALGALLGYLYFWTGNLWIPILAHFAHNGFQVIVVYLKGEEPLSDLNISEVVLPSYLQTLIFSTLAIGLAFYIHHSNRENRLKHPD